MGKLEFFPVKSDVLEIFAESGKFSYLDKSGNFLPKFDQLEYLQVNRKNFRQIGKISTFPSFSKIIFRPIGEGGIFSN